MTSRTFRTAKIIPLLILLTLATNVSAGNEEEKFTKLDIEGNPLPLEATQWAMVKDHSTDLTWEIKTTDNSIHDKDNFYSWIEATEVFIVTLNKENFGGFDDWRIPNTDEFQTIRVKENNPQTNTDFFPHTAPSKFLTYEICGDGSFITKKIKFGKDKTKTKGTRARAVRGGELPKRE